MFAEAACLQDEGHDDDGDGDAYGGALGPTIAELLEDDGYVSPEFDLPSESEREDEWRPPAKKPRRNLSSAAPTLEDEEQLALQMLRSRR